VCVLLCLLAVAVPVHAESLRLTGIPSPVIPGSLSQISFEASAAMTLDIMVLDSQGVIAAVIAKGYEASAGTTTLGWDGLYFGEPITPGFYHLVLSGGGLSDMGELTVDESHAIFTQVMLHSHLISPDSPLTMDIAASHDATLVYSLFNADNRYILGSCPVGQESVTVVWKGFSDENGRLTPLGDYTLELTLRDALTHEDILSEHYAVQLVRNDSSDVIGKSGETEKETITAESYEEPPPVFTPAHLLEPHCQDKHCYWSTPMDITNEAAVWEMLMAPMTVVKGNQRRQIRLLSEPDEKSALVGDVTCATQSVHVLGTLDNGWSYVETYSSSFHDSKIKAWNALVRGYVKTDQLEVKEPGNKEFGIVVDKLTQRLYIFRNGKLIAELLCSTGLGTARQPYNETRSGEFFLISAVGEFASDNLHCPMAIRFNSGDLIHEVPHIDNADGSPNFRTTEPKLGQRASHGCIRVQRVKNADGINMKWIWDNMYRNIANKTVKLAIWEDFPGRQIPLPSADTILYYNPNGGSNYHLREVCSAVRDKFLPLTPFRYGDFELPEYKKLTACPNCCSIRRPEDIRTINEKNAITD